MFFCDDKMAEQLILTPESENAFEGSKNETKKEKKDQIYFCSHFYNCCAIKIYWVACQQNKM